MCRLFGFRSRVSLSVQRSLVKAENAVSVQSGEHRDGWGIAYYAVNATEPMVILSDQCALEDHKFERAAGFVASHTVLAHVRRATIGVVDETNTHPFQFGRWAFAHNGTLWALDRAYWIETLDDDLRETIRGTTDSEMSFLVLLQRMRDAGIDLDKPPQDVGERCVPIVEELYRAFWEECDRGCTERPPLWNFILTDGIHFIVHRAGLELVFSTQKKICGDEEICPVHDKVCFGPRRDVPHTHFLVASEPTSDDDVWEAVPDHGILVLTDDLRLKEYRYRETVAPWPHQASADTGSV